MRPTKYNKRITIQEKTGTTTATGGIKDSWSDLYSSWASVSQVSGSRRFEYGQMNFTEVYEVEMRKRNTNVDADCRVVYNGNTYQITSISMDDEKVKMDIAR
jgi:SPP1 family predicted phage head-tail adaptor